MIDHISDEIDVLSHALQPGWHRTSQWLNSPIDVNDRQGNCLVIVYKRNVGDDVWEERIFYNPLKNALWIRSCQKNVWGNWLKIAVAEAPQEFMLSLAEGVNGWLRYSLNQTGFVQIQLYFTSTDGLDTHTLLAILPVGYRPLHAVVCPIVCRKSNGIHSGFLDIRTDGSVYADTYGDGGKATYGGASFSFRAVV